MKRLPPAVLPFAFAMASFGASLADAASVDSAPYSFLIASVLQGDGDLVASESAYSEAIRLRPGDAFLRLAYADFLAQTGRIAQSLEEISTARTLAPQESAVDRLEARVAMQRADRDPEARQKARDAFERWLSSEPDDLEALVALGQLHLGEGNAARAAELLERAAVLRPGQPMIEGLRGRALALSGEGARAEAVQRQLLRDHPERLDVRFELAEALSESGRTAAAAEILADAPADQARSPELRRRRAIAALLESDLDSARTLATELLAEFPESPAVRMLSATVERSDGQWQRVLDSVSPLVGREGAPPNAGALELEALERLGRIDEALGRLDRQIEIEQARGATAEALALSLRAADLALAADRPQDAIRRARIIDALPEVAGNEPAERARDANVAWLLADAALSEKNWAGAREALLALDLPAARARQYEIATRSGDLSGASALRARLARGAADERLSLAESELRLERFTEAVAVYRELLAGDPESLRVRFGLASGLERAGQKAAAEAEFERILTRFPDHAASLNYLGYMWIEQATRLERAVPMVERAVRADPTNAAFLDSLGWGYHQLGRHAEAIVLLERATRFERDDATILEHLGDAFAASGDVERARAAYERALGVADSKSALTAKIARLPRTGGNP